MLNRKPNNTAKIRTSTIVLLIMLFIVAGIPFYDHLFNHMVCAYLDKMHDLYTQKSHLPVTVTLVAAEKDFDLLPYCVKSIRKYLKHPINNITLVAHRSPKAEALARSLNLEFIDENELLDFDTFNKYLISCNLPLKYRPKWYYQQFLKLYFYKKSPTRYFFVIDADIILTKPMVLVTDEDIHYFYVGENGIRLPAQQAVKKILGKKQFVPKFSFVADFMCFDKNITKDLIQMVEKQYKKPFHQATLELLENSTATTAIFSEYELYGVYANFHKNNNFITSYIQKSDVILKRKYLLKHLNKPLYRFLPYIAYHHWAQRSNDRMFVNDSLLEAYEQIAQAKGSKPRLNK